MRIAFDVDETLIPYGREFPVERSVPSPLFALWFREQLRQGTTGLLRELAGQGCEVWIYTTSGRTTAYFRSWFLLLGIRLGGVVNRHVHEKVVCASGGGFPRCSKYPPAFDIDLLVDNCRGVVLEGERHGFDVVHVEPADPNWTEVVLEAVRLRRHLVSTQSRTTTTA